MSRAFRQPTPIEQFDGLFRSSVMSQCYGIFEDRDHGDEDDVHLPPPRSYGLPRDLARALAHWRFRTGGVVVYYPAVRLPSLPDHDPGDEQPRLIPRSIYDAEFRGTIVV